MMEWIKSYFPAICAGVMALTISWLMDMRAGKPKAFAACGALVLRACGDRTLFIRNLLRDATGSRCFFGGAFIGFYGADNPERHHCHFSESAKLEAAAMQVSDNGIVFLKNEEGEKLTGYPDSRGIPTIGVGHTGKS